MADSPWHVRIAPLMVYIAMLGPVGWLRDVQPWTYPLTYGVQCALTMGLLWRYRRWLVELNWKFHLSAVWVGSIVFVAWMVIGFGMMELFPRKFGSDAGYDYFAEMGEPVGWASMLMRLAGMTIAVPMCEELFHRSCTLRSFNSFRKTAIGSVNLLQDLPVLDDLIRHHDLAKRAGRHEMIFSKEFERVPLGVISLWAMLASSVLFMFAHGMRDWPACIFCGFAYCLIVWWTNRGDRKLGLGPAVWAHAITNAQIWIYTIAAHYLGMPDWRFLG